MLHDQNLPADKPDIVWPPSKQNREDGGESAPAQGRCDGEGKHEARKCQKDVGEAQDRHRDSTLDGPRLVPIASHESKASAEEGRERRHDKADRQVEREGRHHAGQHVTAEIVRPEQMFGRRGEGTGWIRIVSRGNNPSRTGGRVVVRAVREDRNRMSDQGLANRRQKDDEDGH